VELSWSRSDLPPASSPTSCWSHYQRRTNSMRCTVLANWGRFSKASSCICWGPVRLCASRRSRGPSTTSTTAFSISFRISVSKFPANYVRRLRPCEVVLSWFVCYFATLSVNNFTENVYSYFHGTFSINR